MRTSAVAILPAPSSNASLWPGLALCVAVTVLACALQLVEIRLVGRAWLESLVIAVVIGTCIRTAWLPGPQWSAGIRFSAKTLLEVAVVLLGANVSAGMIANAGGGLLAGIVAVVFVSLFLSYGFGRALGLPRRMAILIACGNSICGNSAIAAVAPIIDAHADDVAGAIAFTAVLGVAVVLGLPVIAVLLRMTPTGFGVLAGLTVYAVPQVLAATAPISSLSAQVGTLVKLVRVLMLGPVVLGLSWLVGRTRRVATAPVAGSLGPRTSASLGALVPWFILGFVLMVVLRSIGALPQRLLAPLSRVSDGLTITAMAALGLGVDVRELAKAGARVTLVVVLSLLALGSVAWGLIRLLGWS
jgi:uncharacterized integral membrane protein (TIGR00698 family)